MRTIFAQADAASAREQLDQIADTLTPRFPAAAELLRAAREDLLAYTAFPVAHWRKIWSTNPLERLNKEIPVFDCADRWAVAAAPRLGDCAWV